ncbi:rod shape-determining protein MreC [Weeksellaceae bacterium TAE3-ERU29]|nr:rod shape-determining protein MreC [Weeksellaceae bacterium TAE3-ERU29]
MRLLANLISKIGVFIFFLILEAVSIFFMFSNSSYHKSVIGKSFMDMNGYFSEKVSYVTQFFDLPEENIRLASENAKLRQDLKNTTIINRNDSTLSGMDSIYNQKFIYKPAQIIDYSLRKKDNYFLINKGKADGIKEDMAVVFGKGIVGAVLSTSDHYASVISILHSKTNIKAKVKNLNYFGIIKWDGEDHRKLSLTEIPKYLSIKVGDTVVTAGASAIYPEGEMIGKVTKLVPNNQTGDFNIEVTTFEDLANVKNVYVIENLDRANILEAQEKQQELIDDTE